MGYYGSRHNPLFGNSTTDETPSSATWYGEKRYRNLTINSGVTIQSGTTGYGPLILRCSGTLTVKNGGKIHANEKGESYRAIGLFRPNSNNSEIEAVAGSYGGNAVDGGDWSLSQPLPIPGGGGSGPFGCVLGLGYVIRYRHRIYSDDCVAPGADGDSILEAGFDPADFVSPEHGLFAIGCGGGLTAELYAGGVGGGGVLIIARRILIETGGIIEANGGDGAVGAGGGGGGMVAAISESYTNNGTVQALGGTGGVGGGNGMNGVVKIMEAA